MGIFDFSCKLYAIRRVLKVETNFALEKVTL